MENTQAKRSVWWELSSTGPCMVLRRLIDRHNQASFDPFYWLAVCYCSPEFERADIIAPPLHPNRETLNYLVTGLVDPPDLEDEHLARPEGTSRWINVVGGLKQADPSQSVYVLNMELWMHTAPGAEGGGQRWEFESEHVPLVRTADAQVRVLCGAFEHRQGSIAQHPLGTTILDVTLNPGGSFAYRAPAENTTILYVFGGRVHFGSDEKACFAKDSFLRICGGELRASSRASGGRFLLFSAKPIAHKKPAVCPENEDVCRIKK